MAINDWKSVDAAIFHDVHHSWIQEIQRALNADFLPADYYAMAEQLTGGFGPDVLPLRCKPQKRGKGVKEGQQEHIGSLLQLAPPPVAFTAETSGEYCRRRPSSVTVRSVSGDHLVAVVEIVSPESKSAKHAFRALIEKLLELLEFKINLLILDLIPQLDEIRTAFTPSFGKRFPTRFLSRRQPPSEKPLTLVAYESAWSMKASIQPMTVGDSLPDMPLYLEPGGCVWVPLEKTYRAAFAAMPRRWQTVLEP